MLLARSRLAFRSAALIALAAALAVILPAGTASAAGRPAAETRVWASSLAAQLHVRADRLVFAGQHQGDPASCPFCTPGACVAPEAAGAAPEFSVAPRVLGQLQDARLGPLAGKLTTQDLQGLANSRSAQVFFDARTGNVNVLQQVDGVYLRITTPADEFKIISIGPYRPNNILNLIKRGDYIPIGPGE